MTLGQLDDVTKWMGDWRIRGATVTQLALINLVMSLRRLGRDGEAADVTKHALTLRPDQTYPRHVRVARVRPGQRLLPARSGQAHRDDRLREARAVLQGAVPDGVDPGADGRRLDCARTATSDLRKLREIMDRLDAEAPWAMTKPELKRQRDRALASIVRACGGFLATPWWCKRRILRPMLPLLVAGIVLAGIAFGILSGVKRH
jgi:hypothetical protein